MKRFTLIIIAVAVLPYLLAATAISVNAPPDATYITQTANGVLSAEQALSSLSTGLMKVTTTTGAITSITDSAGLAGALSDETGTGLAVFATSPTLTTPILGTPTSGNLTNCTGVYKTGATTSAPSFIGCYGSQAAPPDATTYFFGAPMQVTASTMTTTAARRRIYFPSAGTITKAYVLVTNDGGTAGTSETSTLSFRLNDTTDTTIINNAIVTSATGAFNNTSLSIAVAAGDYMEIKWVTPTWATNPTNIEMAVQLEFHP